MTYSLTVITPELLGITHETTLNPKPLVNRGYREGLWCGLGFKQVEEDAPILLPPDNVYWVAVKERNSNYLGEAILSTIYV